MRRGNYQGPRRVVVSSSMRRDWEEYDPRMEEYYDPVNVYTSGPGLYLPSDNLPYSIRTSELPYKLFVSGIHPHTTEEGIRHIFSNYGFPLSVYRTRNKFNNPIAFVEFETQVEANNAIAQLDGKPPLNWEVAYAAPRNDERLHQQPDYCLESDYDRQTPLFTTHRTVGMRQVAYPRPPPEMCSSHPTEPVRQTRDILSDQACGVCGQKADFLCTHCKARYCSPDCQSRDWPTHREICVPPPPLVAANNFDGNVMRAPRIHGPNVSSVPCQSGPYVHSTRPTEGAVGGVTLSMNARQQNNSAEMGSPHSYMIKGIHPLDQTEAVNQQPSSTTTPRNGKIENVNMIITRTETHSGSLGSREVIMSGEATHSLGKTVHLQQNGQVKKSPASSRSPNWKNNGSPQSNSKTHGTPQQNNSAGPTVNGHLKQNGGDTTMQPVSKTRNYPLSNYSSKSPITSPPKRTPPPVVAKIYAKEFSKRELKPLSSKPCEISVCFAKSPEEFYIQYACFREMLQKMTTGIQISAPNSDAIMNPAEGMPCLAVFHQDRQWYRGKVVKVFPDGIGVRYVDFGNTAKMPNSPENFRLMEHEFSEYPFFTFKAKLAEILPLDGNSWQHDVKQKFKALTEDNFFLMEVVESGTEILTVRLKSQDNTDIATVLINNGLARTAMREFQISDELDQMKSANGTPSPTQRNPIQGLPISFDKLSLTTKPATKQMSPVSPQSTSMMSAIPTQLRAPTVSPTRAALRGTPIVQPRVPSLPATLSPMRCKTPSVVASPSPSQPTDDSIVNVLEVGVLFMFSVNVVYGPGIFVGTALRDEDACVMEFDLLAEPLESLPNFKPSVGSVVAAFSVAHGQWFRACITNVLKSAYDVLYVDFGNVEEGVVSVKPIPPTYQHVELAVNMKASGDLNAEITKFFEEKVVLDSSHPLEIVSKERDGSVLAKFVGVTPSFLVSLKSWRSLLAQPEAKMRPSTEIQSEATTSPIVENRLDSAVPSPKMDIQLEKVHAPVREIQCSKWEPGFSSDVMIYVAEDVDRIYVQTVNSETISLIEIIQGELNAVFPTSPEMKTIPAVGTCVAALFPEDGVVYRARIMGSNEGAICVFYMDFGNSCTVSLADIKVLPDKLYDYPPLCQRVALARVHRPAGALPKAVQDVLLNCINNLFNMLILPSSSGRTECTLTKDGQILNEVVVDLFEQTSQDSLVKTPTTMPKLETVVPQSVSPPKEKIQVDNTLGEYFYQDGPFLELPKEGTFQAVVLSAESPQVLMLRVNNDDISAKLAQLENELAEYAERAPRGHSPKPSEICIALFPDGKWHRAACLEVIPDPSGTRFTCIEVDHGHMHVIDLEFIRRIPKRFVEFLPYLAQQTILEGTENIEQISAVLSERFSGILSENSIVSLTVVSRLDDVCIVRIPKVRDMLSQEGLL